MSKMAPREDAADLYAPFTSDTILEVRSGKLKKYKGLNIESGIDKSLLDEPVHVGKLGIDGDEHDLTFHGGPDKAVHGCESESQACCFLLFVVPFLRWRILGLITYNMAPKGTIRSHIYTYAHTRH